MFVQIHIDGGLRSHSLLSWSNLTLACTAWSRHSWQPWHLRICLSPVPYHRVTRSHCQDVDPRHGRAFSQAFLIFPRSDISGSLEESWGWGFRTVIDPGVQSPTLAKTKLTEESSSFLDLPISLSFITSRYHYPQSAFCSMALRDPTVIRRGMVCHNLVFYGKWKCHRKQ